MTKHAVVGLSKALRVEAQFRGVRVSVVCPGVIRTPMLRGGKHGVFRMSLSEDKQREIAGQFFEFFRPMDVSVFARKVLDQVARNRATIIVPGWYKIAWWIERASPSLGSRLARRNFERYRKLELDSRATTHDETNRDAV